ncbi:hypothetical protein ACWD4O_38775 [Streptomyces sp. NPDC002623]
MPDQTGPEHSGPDLTPEQKLAATVEAVFASHRRSLTDSETALDFTITLGIVINALKAALAQGKLTPEEFKRLNGLMTGMLEAPRLLA